MPAAGIGAAVKKTSASLAGLVVSAIGALSAIVACAMFWINRGKSDQTAKHALEKAKEAHNRYDQLHNVVTDYRVMTARDIAVVKTLAEANMITMSAAETRLAKSLDDVTDRLETSSTSG